MLKDRIAIVTGGATGIGRAIGLVLAGDGANIVVADLDLEQSERTAAEIGEKGVETMAVVSDVTKAWMPAKMASAVKERFGQIDILVNNAGVAGAPGWQEHAESREEDWLAAFEVNVKGIFHTVEAIAPVMKEQRSGKIVNIASIAGREGRPSLPHYSASKAAVINYTQSLAAELAGFNVNVNAVCPGLLWTPMWEQVGVRYAKRDPRLEELSAREVFDQMVDEIIPLGREQTPEDIGNCVAFLVSDDAENITGQAVNVDGGAFLR